MRLSAPGARAGTTTDTCAPSLRRDARVSHERQTAQTVDTRVRHDRQTAQKIRCMAGRPVGWRRGSRAAQPARQPRRAGLARTPAPHAAARTPPHQPRPERSGRGPNGPGRGPNGSGRGAHLSTRSTATPAAATPPKATAGGAPGATPGNPASPRRSVSPPAAVATLGQTETTRGAGCRAVRARPGFRRAGARRRGPTRTEHATRQHQVCKVWSAKFVKCGAPSL